MKVFHVRITRVLFEKSFFFLTPHQSIVFSNFRLMPCYFILWFYLQVKLKWLISRKLQFENFIVHSVQLICNFYEIFFGVHLQWWKTYISAGSHYPPWMLYTSSSQPERSNNLSYFPFLFMFVACFMIILYNLRTLKNCNLIVLFCPSANMIVDLWWSRLLILASLR